jgi:hypothetical protein
MLEKVVDTDVGIPAKYWKPIGFMYSIAEEAGVIEMHGFATENAERSLVSCQVKIDENDMDTIRQCDWTDYLSSILEGVVESNKEWQNLK